MENQGSDRDIKAWEKRLLDQAGQRYDNYIHRRIDLTTARVDEPLYIPGDYLYVEDSSDDKVAVAKIRFQRNTNDQLDLEEGNQFYTVFTQVFISNEALQGEWLDLFFGINFIYKKKIAGDGFVNPIVTAAGVDLVLLPGAGGITQIGDAGATSRGLVANDDLFVSGKLEVDGVAYFDGQVHLGAMLQTGSAIRANGTRGSYMDWFVKEEEEVTIPVGQGAAGVVSATTLVRANSIVLGVVCRVTQAPGGGAATLDIGRTNGGNLDEFIDGIATALGTNGLSTANHDAATPYPVLNGPVDTFTLTTDANVLVSDMKVRIYVYHALLLPLTS